jgi:dipeptidyl aminopeptidase/acylaminoacyl peptidase
MPQPQYTIADFLESRSAMGPSFSPSGAKIAYLSNLSGTFQAYVADLAQPELVDGGPVAAKQVTDFADGLSFVEFSPVDEDLLIFGKDEGGNERHQIYLLNVGTGEIKPLTSEKSAMHRFGGWSRDGGRIAYSSHKRNGSDHDVYVLDLATMSEQMVFDLGSWCECFGFSPSGRYLVVSKTKSGGYLDTELYLVDLESGVPPKLLTPHKEKAYFALAEWRQDDTGFWTLTDSGQNFIGIREVPIYSSVGTLQFRGKEAAREMVSPWRYSAAAPDGSPLVFHFWSGGLSHVVSLDRNFEEIMSAPDNSKGAICANLHGYSEISIGREWQESIVINPNGQAAGLAWSRDASKLAFSVTRPDSSQNIWVWDAKSENASPITSMPMGVPSEVMVQPELIKYTSFDGLDIPAFLYLLHDPKPQMPAVVYIHGGPEGQSRPAFNPIIQYFVYRGYAVIAPNVRGSDGYGKKYLALDDRFKRLDSVRDLEGLHAWIERDGRIDPKRVALMGGSYGGYMVLAGLAFQPELWAAGVDIVGIASLVTFLENTSSYRRAVREAEYGYLATDRDFLESASPLNKVEQIRAPLFIIHGANDPRVPLSEAIQMRDSLAKRNVHAELLVYDNEGHGLSKLKNRLDAYPKAAAFLDSVLSPTDV